MFDHLEILMSAWGLAGWSPTPVLTAVIGWCHSEMTTLAKEPSSLKRRVWLQSFKSKQTFSKVERNKWHMCLGSYKNN